MLPLYTLFHPLLQGRYAVASCRREDGKRLWWVWPAQRGGQNVGMYLLFDFTHQTGIRVAEIGFLLILIAGVWLAAAEMLNPERWRKFRTIVAGVLLAIAGLLLIIAAHWGQFD